MTQHSRSNKKSKAWLRAHIEDPWVKRASQEGWRSRAVFKLKEIDEKVHLLKPGISVVDLGAAPGSWSQYAVRRIQPAGRLIALDLLSMTALSGVEFIQGDFREESVLAELAALLGGGQADLVLSDLAPNLTGIAASDQAQMSLLAERTLDFCRISLKPGGSLLIKVFQGEEFLQLKKTCTVAFTRLTVNKPAASRDRSAETYLLGQGWRGLPNCSVLSPP